MQSPAATIRHVAAVGAEGVTGGGGAGGRAAHVGLAVSAARFARGAGATTQHAPAAVDGHPTVEALLLTRPRLTEPATHLGRILERPSAGQPYHREAHPSLCTPPPVAHAPTSTRPPSGPRGANL
ncbi:hypothetical protein D187_005313 [Cystobacter fuscus DSM 2262]|uniref:Uncharacterized protein n=1 Tax=Cystobacter fuscus (strain ATCC 25194 / DSM 2262 / NBRC 100088 / M29) TaxID=1242864 RepID=S9QSD6_CYSF2|nr:hypothetical protein D187_005313 [Cystobacter fuscus DSM 2262]